MKKIRVLIADDYLDNRLLLHQIATVLNYETVLVENGLEAVKAFQSSNNIDIILMDIEMPVMNGIEAARELRKEFTLPIIAITAHNPEHFANKLQKVGFNDYIAKPYTLDKIQNVIRTYI